MKKNSVPIRVILIILCVVLTLQFVGTSVDAAVVDYRSWGTGTNNGFNNGTSYQGWCLAHAYTKILIQSGAYSSSFTPDTMDQTMRNRYGVGVTRSSGYCNFGMSHVVGISNGKLTSAQEITVGGTVAQKKNKVMEYVRAGYQIILVVPGHFVAIDNISSLAYGTPYVMNAITTANYDYRVNNSVVPIDYAAHNYSGFTTMRVFKTSGGNTTQPIMSLDSDMSANWVDTLGSTEAVINGTFWTSRKPSEVGFYIGTSTSNMVKRTEYYSGSGFKKCWYSMNKWYGQLTPGTTYYYKFYMLEGGMMYESSVKSFTTLYVKPTTASLTANKSTYTTSDSLTFTATGNNKPTSYTLNVDQGSTRVLSKSMSTSGSLTVSALPVGTYTAYVTAANSAGSISSAKINFNVVENLSPVANKLSNITETYVQAPYISGAPQRVEAAVKSQLQSLGETGVQVAVASLSVPAKQADGTTYVGRYKITLSRNGGTATKELTFTQQKNSATLSSVASKLSNITNTYNQAPYISGAPQRVVSAVNSQLASLGETGVNVSVTTLSAPTVQSNGTTYVGRYRITLSRGGVAATKDLSFTQQKNMPAISGVASKLNNITNTYNQTPYIAGAPQRVVTSVNSQLASLGETGVNVTITTLSTPTVQSDGTTYVGRYRITLSRGGVVATKDLTFTQQKK